MHRFKTGLTQRLQSAFSHERLRNCEDLAGLSEKCLLEIFSELSIQMFPEGKLIMKEGEAADKLFILSGGSVEILVGPEDSQVSVILEPTILGPWGLFTHGRREASVRALAFCDCRVISAQALKDVLSRHPEAKAAFERLAAARLFKVRQVLEKYQKEKRLAALVESAVARARPKAVKRCSFALGDSLAKTILFDEGDRDGAMVHVPSGTFRRAKSAHVVRPGTPKGGRTVEGARTRPGTPKGLVPRSGTEDDEGSEDQPSPRAQPKLGRAKTEDLRSSRGGQTPCSGEGFSSFCPDEGGSLPLHRRTGSFVLADSSEVESSEELFLEPQRKGLEVAEDSPHIQLERRAAFRVQTSDSEEGPSRAEDLGSPLSRVRESTKLRQLKGVRVQTADRDVTAEPPSIPLLRVQTADSDVTAEPPSVPLQRQRGVRVHTADSDVTAEPPSVPLQRQRGVRVQTRDSDVRVSSSEKSPSIPVPRPKVSLATAKPGRGLDYEGESSSGEEAPTRGVAKDSHLLVDGAWGTESDISLEAEGLLFQNLLRTTQPEEEDRSDSSLGLQPTAPAQQTEAKSWSWQPLSQILVKGLGARQTSELPSGQTPRRQETGDSTVSQRSSDLVFGRQSPREEAPRPSLPPAGELSSPRRRQGPQPPACRTPLEMPAIKAGVTPEGSPDAAPKRQAKVQRPSQGFLRQLTSDGQARSSRLETRQLSMDDAQLDGLASPSTAGEMPPCLRPSTADTPGMGQRPGGHRKARFDSLAVLRETKAERPVMPPSIRRPF